jgi:hypothetical protein
MIDSFRDHQIVLGVDAREMWLGATAWNEERRRKFLLRLDVDKPLSIDPQVWPSVFDALDDIRPAYTGLFHGLWDSREQLEESLKRAPLRDRRYRIVAYAVVTGTLTEAERKPWDMFQVRNSQDPKPTPSTVDPTWTLLGYDLADASGVSGLMNMGFVPGHDDVDRLRSEWGPYLARSHLFESREWADAFRAYSNGRVPSHAPFFVYAVWLLEERYGGCG